MGWCCLSLAGTRELLSLSRYLLKFLAVSVQSSPLPRDHGHGDILFIPPSCMIYLLSVFCLGREVAYFLRGASTLGSPLVDSPVQVPVSLPP